MTGAIVEPAPGLAAAGDGSAGAAASLEVDGPTVADAELEPAVEAALEPVVEATDEAAVEAADDVDAESRGAVALHAAVVAMTAAATAAYRHIRAARTG